MNTVVPSCTQNSISVTYQPNMSSVLYQCDVLGVNVS